jgi:hypothetical protein
MKKETKKRKELVEYYESRGILKDVTDDSVDLVLDKTLRQDIISGKRKRKPKNITIKID